MKYHELNVESGQNRKRVGRGISAGQGKTAGRGTKGQNARTGKKLRPTFTGGQLPLVQAIPKLRGFKSKRVPAQVVYADLLNQIKKSTIDNFALFEAGLIATPFSAVKIIARGELTTKATVNVSGMSQSVQDALSKNGGKFEKTPVPLPKSAKPGSTRSGKSKAAPDEKADKPVEAANKSAAKTETTK
ncbi:MAG: 50S ribosomal protein L15 [Candidatus Nomurabacteria bacterium]|jgi:large subunit ribosomal protein L15|nr:50S ribosomal protein L15 [Candidatus Nomurabacteria bacterium]